MADPAEPPTSSCPGATGDNTITGLELLKIAEKIPDTGHYFLGVGKALGISYKDLRRQFLTSPRKCFRRTTTFNLWEWNKRQPQDAPTRELLATAFQQVSFVDLGVLAEEIRYGSFRPKTTAKARTASSQIAPGYNTSGISDMELEWLSRKIPSTRCIQVGTSLGIPFETLYYLFQTSSENPDTAMFFLTGWNNGNHMHQPPDASKRELLADALELSDLGDLAEVIRRGSLSSNIIAKGRTASSQIAPGYNTSGIDDMELELVSRKIPSTRLTQVGTFLGIRFDKLYYRFQISGKNPYTAKVFLTEWNNGNHMHQPPGISKRELLANALEWSDLGDLAEVIRRGSLSSNIIGPFEVNSSAAQYFESLFAISYYFGKTM